MIPFRNGYEVGMGLVVGLQQDPGPTIRTLLHVLQYFWNQSEPQHPTLLC